MNRPGRLILGVLAFGAYVIGLAVAGMAVFLAFAIGPFDSFAAGMIVVPGVVGVAGGAGVAWASGPFRRRLAIVALLIGASLVAATVWLMAAYASIGR